LKPKKEIKPSRLSIWKKRQILLLKVRLEGINSEDEARKYLKNPIKVSREELSEADLVKISLRELSGFKVIDEKAGDAGIIKGIMELPNNPLARNRLQRKKLLASYSRRHTS
jgi:ribosomal 30S subunit maturation factor RimM